MPHKIYKATISADGELTEGDELTDLSVGDRLELNINGHQLTSGTEPLTLLGKRKGFLPHSHQLELTNFQQLPDGSCQLSYIILG